MFYGVGAVKNPAISKRPLHNEGSLLEWTEVPLGQGAAVDFQCSSMTRKTFMKTNDSRKALLTLRVSSPARTLVCFLGLPIPQSPHTRQD